MSSLRDQAEQLVRQAAPVDDVGRALLERYLQIVDWDSTPPTGWPAYHERARLRGLIHAVEQIAVGTVSLESLDLLEQVEAPTAIVDTMKRRALYRLRRALQATGELPRRGELTAARRTDRLLESLDAVGQRRFAAWFAHRGHELAPPQLKAEARHLVVLEQLAATHPHLDDDALIALWRSRIVTRVVKCPCPPVLRITSPHVCHRCGRTSTRHGTRVTPNAANQRKLMAAARRYLDFVREEPQ